MDETKLGNLQDVTILVSYDLGKTNKKQIVRLVTTGTICKLLEYVWWTSAYTKYISQIFDTSIALLIIIKTQFGFT